MANAAAILIFLVGLAGGLVACGNAGSNSLGLAPVVHAMVPCYLVLIVFAARAARGGLALRGRAALIAGLVAVALLLGFGRVQVRSHEESVAARVALSCFSFQCEMADSRASIEERRRRFDLARTRTAAGEILCRYLIDNRTLSCAIHGTPRPMPTVYSTFAPPCPGPVQVPEELAR